MGRRAVPLRGGKEKTNVSWAELMAACRLITATDIVHGTAGNAAKMGDDDRERHRSRLLGNCEPPVLYWD